MTKRVSYFRVGLFVLLGFSLGAISLVLFGSEDFFGGRGFLFETYLDESVEGIDVGSPVKYRGVNVGQVDEIVFVRNLYPEAIDLEGGESFGSYVAVKVQLEPGVFGEESYEAVFQQFQREAANGLRVILTPKGLTGTAYLEIDYRDPEGNPPLAINFTPAELYLPSTTSTLRRFATGVDEILRKLVDTDIDEAFSEMALLLSSVRATNERVRDLLNDPVIDGIPADAAATVASLRDLAAEAGPKLGVTLDDLASTSRSLTALAERVDTLLSEEGLAATLASTRAASTEIAEASRDARNAIHRVDRLVGDSEADISALVLNMRSVSENLKTLTELAERYPALLLFGEAPARNSP